jgi:hypothetical protein
VRTSHIGIHKRLADCAQLMGLVGLLLSSPAVADIYPIKGAWVAPNPDFPIRPDEACFTVRLSGIEAVTPRSHSPRGWKNKLARKHSEADDPYSQRHDEH